MGRRDDDLPRARPPIKGKRRVFDEDSAPTQRERERMASGSPEEPTRYVDDGPLRRAAGDAVERGARSPRTTQRRAERAAKRVEGLLEVDAKRLRTRLGAQRAERTLLRIGEATAAFSEDRYDDSRRILKPIADLVPDEPAVRELLGLSYYRLGKWKQAVVELDEFVRMTDSTEQHPVLADCHRALGNHDLVEELWEELGDASVAASVVAEGRIVLAGSLADRGRITDAIKVMEAGSLGTKRLLDHHLRMRYVLGDLYDRAGDRQQARRQFAAVAEAAPDFFDVSERLAQL